MPIRRKKDLKGLLVDAYGVYSESLSEKMLKNNGQKAKAKQDISGSAELICGNARVRYLIANTPLLYRKIGAKGQSGQRYYQLPHRDVDQYLSAFPAPVRDCLGQAFR